MRKELKQHMKAEGNYTFKCINLSDYNLECKLLVKGRLIEILFNKAKSTFYKLNKMNVQGDLSKIKSFKVEDEKYHALYKVALKTQLKDIFNQVAADGIVVLREKVKECEFVREENNTWTIKITFEGQYIDKR